MHAREFVATNTELLFAAERLEAVMIELQTHYSIARTYASNPPPAPLRVPQFLTP